MKKGLFKRNLFIGFVVFLVFLFWLVIVSFLGVFNLFTYLIVGYIANYLLKYVTGINVVKSISSWMINKLYE